MNKFLLFIVIIGVVIVGFVASQIGIKTLPSSFFSREPPIPSVSSLNPYAQHSSDDLKRPSESSAANRK